MGNAKYHKSRPKGLPKGSNKKYVLQAFVKEHNLTIPPGKLLKIVLWGRVNAYINKSFLPVVCQMAKDAGHEVIHSPPHYSDLQPIEIVWANVKGEVGRQHTTDTTFKEVLVRLEAAFAKLQSCTVQGCINKPNKHLNALFAYIVQLEENDDMDDDEEDYEEDDIDDQSLSQFV